MKAVSLQSFWASLLFDAAYKRHKQAHQKVASANKLPHFNFAESREVLKNKNTLNKKFTSPRLRPGEKRKKQKHKKTAVYQRHKTKHQRTVGRKSFPVSFWKTVTGTRRVLVTNRLLIFFILSTVILVADRVRSAGNKGARLHSKPGSFLIHTQTFSKLEWQIFNSHFV